jgi:hypothetical protein
LIEVGRYPQGKCDRTAVDEFHFHVGAKLARLHTRPSLSGRAHQMLEQLLPHLWWCGRLKTWPIAAAVSATRVNCGTRRIPPESASSGSCARSQWGNAKASRRSEPLGNAGNAPFHTDQHQQSRADGGYSCTGNVHARPFDAL